MPILCPVNFETVSTESFGKLDYSVMAHAFAAHNELGRLADEIVYQRDFLHRLQESDFDVQREVPIEVAFESFRKQYRLDVVIERQGIYELKAVDTLTGAHQAQLLNYLLLLDLARGKLINFRPSSVRSRFVNAATSRSQRQSFTVDDARWKCVDNFRELFTALLRDWGTGLELHLYLQAMIHLLGGEEKVTVLRPMKRQGKNLGNQRFHLIDKLTAFRLTGFSRLSPTYESHLQRLLLMSSLERIGWVNITINKVTFTMVTVN